MRSFYAAIETCSTEIVALQKAVLQFISGEKLRKIFIREFIFSKIASKHPATLLKNNFPHRCISRLLTTNAEHLFFNSHRMADFAFCLSMEVISMVLAPAF